MKYNRLTKEQLESFSHEFAQFLATQGIDKAKWEEFKNTNSQIVEEELDLFSDMVWEQILEKMNYIEHYSSQFLNLFKCTDEAMERIVIQCNTKDFLVPKDLEWVLQNLTNENVEILHGKKKYEKERNQELFDLIQMGGVLSKGILYESVAKSL